MKTTNATLVTNRKARFDYSIIEKKEAGLVLKGAEVKSIRAGKANLKESFVVFDNQGQLWLINTHISPYQNGPQNNFHPTRRRKLLLHQKELQKLQGQVQTKRLTLIPLRLYDKHGLIKIEVALAQGKKKYDKKKDIKERDIKRETQRALKNFS